MSPKRTTIGYLNFSEIKNRTVFLILSLVTFFIRFPFFFRDYIDRDESTFILLGQSWADGFLPYTQLWDLKPPLTFAFFAAVISIFGKSFMAIRLVGALLVAVTAYFSYKIALALIPRKVAVWISLSCVALLSLFGSLQGVMSEHICVAFFVPALYILITKKNTRWFLLSGILMGVSVMVKLNMAFPILTLGLYLFFEMLRKRNGIRFSNILFFSIGIALVILATILPYYDSGQLLVWWESVVLAPLEYTEARRYPILKLAPIFVAIGLFLLYAQKTKRLDFKDRTVQLLLVAIFGVLISFIKGGRINGHYLIQLHPLLLVLVGVVIFNLVEQYRPKLSKVLVLLLLMAVPVESYMEYWNIVKNKNERNTFFNGEGFSVPKYIKDHRLDTENILFFEYHIGYWNLGKLPPTTAATHPSNICRDELYPFFDNPRKNSLAELKYILEFLKPKTIIVRNGKRIFDKKEIEENAYLDAYLEEHYKILDTVENAGILQRL